MAGQAYSRRPRQRGRRVTQLEREAPGPGASVSLNGC